MEKKRANVPLRQTALGLHIDKNSPKYLIKTINFFYSTSINKPKENIDIDFHNNDIKPEKKTEQKIERDSRGDSLSESKRPKNETNYNNDKWNTFNIQLGATNSWNLSGSSRKSSNDSKEKPKIDSRETESKSEGNDTSKTSSDSDKPSHEQSLLPTTPDNLRTNNEEGKQPSTEEEEKQRSSEEEEKQLATEEEKKHEEGSLTGGSNDTTKRNDSSPEERNSDDNSDSPTHTISQFNNFNETSNNADEDVEANERVQNLDNVVAAEENKNQERLLGNDQVESDRNGQEIGNMQISNSELIEGNQNPGSSIEGNQNPGSSIEGNQSPESSIESTDINLSSDGEAGLFTPHYPEPTKVIFKNQY